MRPNNIEDIYPLSPMQQGILFHTLYAGEPETYLVQVAWTLRGALDASALERAFQQVFDRHPALRTAFAWEKLADPVQIVWRRLKIVFDQHDLRSLPPEERAERARRYAEDDRKRGFDPTRAPLMRFGLLRLGDDAWRFVWSMHHLLLDGWSTQIVVKEVFAIYEGIVRGAPPELPRPRPYAEYIGWLKKQDRAANDAFWKKELAGFAAPTSLGIDRGRATGEASFGSSRRVLSEAGSAALVAFARQHKLTANTLVQGAWAILLSRYAREEDVLFGSTVSGRSALVPGVESMVGLFINTLPVRARPRADLPALSFLTALQAHEAELRDREHSPLAEVQTQSDVPRGTPLFETLVVFENFPIAESLSGASASGGQGGKGTSPALGVTDGAASERPPYPITLTAVLQRSLMLQLAFDARRFDASAIDRMLGHLVTLIEAIVADPSASVGALPMLTPAERTQLVATWNDRAPAFSTDATLHRLFEEQVDRTPDATALIAGAARVSYADLDRRANRIASRLRKLGVGREALVGVCVPRSVEMIAGVLGVLKAGGAYVPVDPAYPASRIAQILEDARAPVLLTLASLTASLPELACERVLLDAEEASLASEHDARAESGAAPDDLAYVIYTSGSTGKPKGVAIAHRPAVCLARWAHGVYSPEELAGVLFSTSICFDLSIFELFVPLSMGGAVVLAENALELPSLPAKDEVTLVNTVPSAMTELVRLQGVPRSVVTVNLAGEALPESLADAVYALPHVAKLYNLYGPTEDTTYSTVSLVPRGAAPDIGVPIAGGLAYILDARMEPVPIGVPGEIYLGGAGLARGYLNRPDLTAERFVESPFTAKGTPVGRIYRTGDLGRYRADGAIEYLGRVDHQVKVRGFRIELGEIDAALLADASVREAVTVVRDDGQGKHLVAYVAPNVAPLAVAELRDALRNRLPHFMLPSAFVELAELPLTPNGKVDRKALPAPDAAAQGAHKADRVAPRTQVEQAIVDVFAEVLKLGADDVGVTESFFDLGGHSLLATQAVTRVRASLGVNVPLRALFDAPSAAAFAARVEALLQSGEREGAPPIVPVPRTARMPLSFGQERLWFLGQLDPDSPAYVIPLALRLAGSLDVDALARVLAELVRRHEVLRTTFASEGGKAAQVIHEPAPVPLPRTSLADMPRDEAERAIRAEAEAEARTPFDLAKGPLLRARLLTMAEDDHVLLLTLHHIVSDVWTNAILNREITALYEAFSTGQPSPLPELLIQYADYAAWQRAWLSGAVLDEHLSYWKKQLEGAPAALDLATDRPRPPAQSYRGAARLFTIPKPLAAKLKELARREGVTLYMTLLAAFDVLLSRWSGQDDIVVGTPIAGRTRAETEGLIGFFLNTQVIRAKVSPDASFKELLARVKEACLGAYAHQDMPFERLVQEIQPEPDPSRSPLFQVIFNLQNVERVGLRMRGLKLRGAVAENATVKVDLTLIMGESADGLSGRLEYSTDLFDAPTIDRFARQLETLYAAVTKEPQRRIGDLAVLPDEERERLLVAWNDTAAPLDTSRCFHELFEEQVDRTPDAIALVAGDARLTYRELDERSNRLAHHLRGKGVGPDAPVGLCLPRTAEIVVAILGIMKAGGAYVPLDPSYPPRRLAQILGDAQAEVVVTDATLAAPIREGDRELARARPRSRAIVEIDIARAAIANESASRPELFATPANLAYVLFTSGSTGTPKGVALEHRQLVNYVLGVASRLALPAGASYAHVSTFSADLGNTVLFPPLATGGVVHVVPEALTTDPDGLSAYFQREGIDCLKIVPSHLFALLSGARSEHVIPRKLLVLGGEGLRWDLVDRIERIAPDCRILNHYGPTEATVGVLTYSIEKGARVPGTTIAPLGRPLPNSRVYVLDAAMAPAPIGVPGEIYIGGSGVARGYLDRPDLTRERFVRDPFVAVGGARLYRSGDRGRVLPDGSIAFLGRVDHQVKIRGFRVELGEIEAALSSCPGLKEAAVLVEEDPSGDKRLVAYIVPSDPSPDLPGIRRLIEQRLPEYMIPSAFVVLDALPLNPNGKVDRRALAALERQRDEAEHVAPQNPVEEVLAAIWCDVFERERIGVHERFNDLGGHSLLAIQIVARARDAFQAEVPLRAIFEAPTIAALAERVAELQMEGATMIAPPIERAPRDRPLPLSFAQERLWFLDRLEPGDASYNVSSGVRLFGPLDVGALERAFGEIVRRHEVLRTTFSMAGEEPVQIIHAEVEVRLATLDLADLPAADRDARVAAEAAAEARAPFDLERGPVLRAKLLRLAPEEHALLLTVHHIVSDAQTQHVLGSEIAALYGAFKEGKPSPLAPLPIQYADYAAWQRAWLSGEVLDRQIAYWRAALEGAPAALDLPTDRPRAPVMTHRGNRRAFTLSAAVRKALVDLSRQRGVTIFMTLLAAFDVLLYRRSGQADIVVGTPMTSRTRAETEGLIGFFLNTLAIRTKLDDGMSFEDLVQRVRDACLGAYAHQDLPFERLVHELSPKRDLSRTPIFQVLFTVQSAGGADEGGLAGVRRRALAPAIETAKFDLSLFLAEGPRGIGGVLEFSTDLFDAATIDRMAAELVTLLEGIAAAPSTAIADLPILPDAERSLVLHAWNATDADWPEEATIVDLFEAQVARTPDAIAASFEGREVTYRALEEQANRLANRLRSLGVGPDVPVGIAMARSLDLVIGVLAILKAGGAYAPLDPDYPASRLALMIEDAKTPIILKQSRFVGALPSHSAGVLKIDEVWGELASESASPPDRAGLDPSHTAYVIFTSGSTGRPKGVEMPHRALVNLVAWQIRTAPGAPRTIQLTSSSFDVFFQEVFTTWCSGGHLVLIPEAVRRDARSLRAALAENRIERMFLPPVALYQLAEIDEGPPLPSSMREVILAGEQIQITPRVAALLSAAPGVVLRNHYGPSESHVVTEEVLTGDPSSWPELPAIGRPIQNARIYLLDARRSPVPIGVPGELYIGGVALARGYLGQPELTAERFVDDPFTAGQRLYRTGDLARHMADGRIEFLGRIDHQVKIRGYRVELGEVESALSHHAGVRDVVVVAREYGPMDKRLVAYVVPSGAAPSVDDLRGFLRARLPDHMIPPVFVILDALPLTPTGKVDRKALPEPAEPAATSDDGYAAPRDEVEVRLAAIWRDVLGLRRVGITDSFFDLGGHSILAVRMMSEVERTFGKKIPLVALFEAQTIDHLAAIVRRGDEDREEWPSLVPMRTTGDKRPLFLVARPNVNSLGYVALIKRLDPAQPVYGLQLQYPEESVLGRPYTLEERHGWAMRYIELMKAVQPEGPYFIAGMCEGALIAFDMVKTLEEVGQQVRFFGVFDTFPEENTSRFWLHRLFIYERTFKMFWRQGPDELYRYVRSRAGRVARTVISRVAPSVKVKGPSLGTRIIARSPWDERMFPGPSFVPPRVDAHIDLFRVRKTYYWRVDDLEFGWGNRTRNGVDVHFIGGDHDTFMRSEHVPLLGKKLREALAAAEEQIEADAAVAARAVAKASATP